MKKLIIIFIVAVLMISGIISYPFGKKEATSENKAKETIGEDSKTHIILISDSSFSPKEIKIKKDETVKWENEDSFVHTIISDLDSFPASTELSKGESYTLTFESAGEHSYHCGIHPSMLGKIIVEEN
ncbi:MAG: cupredoxin domain-containing protein [Nanoarchaeota archaeon]